MDHLQIYLYNFRDKKIDRPYLIILKYQGEQVCDD